VSKETSLRALLQACEKDDALFERFLATPQEVATAYHLELDAEEIEQLQRVHKLKSLVAEFRLKRQPGTPVGYPADLAWKAVLTNHILFYRPIFYPIFYPANPVFEQLRRPKGYPTHIQREQAEFAYKPGPSVYPFDPGLTGISILGGLRAQSGRGTSTK